MSKKAEITQEEIAKALKNFRQWVMRRIMQKARQWGKLYMEAHSSE